MHYNNNWSYSYYYHRHYWLKFKFGCDLIGLNFLKEKQKVQEIRVYKLPNIFSHLFWPIPIFGLAQGLWILSYSFKMHPKKTFTCSKFRFLKNHRWVLIIVIMNHYNYLKYIKICLPTYQIYISNLLSQWN